MVTSSLGAHPRRVYARAARIVDTDKAARAGVRQSAAYHGAAFSITCTRSASGREHPSTHHPSARGHTHKHAHTHTHPSRARASCEPTSRQVCRRCVARPSRVWPRTLAAPRSCGLARAPPARWGTAARARARAIDTDIARVVRVRRRAVVRARSSLPAPLPALAPRACDVARVHAGAQYLAGDPPCVRLPPPQAAPRVSHPTLTHPSSRRESLCIGVLASCPHPTPRRRAPEISPPRARAEGRSLRAGGRCVRIWSAPVRDSANGRRERVPRVSHARR